VSSTIEISICSKISPPDLCESSNHGPGASFRETFAKQGQHKMCCRTAPAIMRKKKEFVILGTVDYPETGKIAGLDDLNYFIKCTSGVSLYLIPLGREVIEIMQDS